MSAEAVKRYCLAGIKSYFAPDCEVVHSADHDRVVSALTADVARLQAALEPLAAIPLEEFGWEEKPDRPITGWNKHTLYARDVLAARAALAAREPA